VSAVHQQPSESHFQTCWVLHLPSNLWGSQADTSRNRYFPTLQGGVFASPGQPLLSSLHSSGACSATSTASKVVRLTSPSQRSTWGSLRKLQYSPDAAEPVTAGRCTQHHAVSSVE
jgi:hypothetical protein